MKKLLFIILLVMMMVSCVEKERRTNRYEVLLSTKDTIYIDAWYYVCGAATFNSRRTVVFYNVHYKKIMTIDNPVYIKEINFKDGN